MSAAAFERQIRPIYDALDTGSNKSAIVSCNKLLKKYPQSELIKSLKALALVRSQKVEESLVLCDEILETKPTNDAVLTAMMHVLRGLGRHKDMVKMFEEAYKQQPYNEELGAQTFFANVRAAQWKSAQVIATRMSKQFQDDRYLYWTVISAMLQASDPATPETMRNILYQLAHRLLVSSPTPSYISAERFYLHLSVLLKLNYIDDAHKLLDSQVGRSICSTNLSCNELRREVWQRKGLVKEEGTLARALIDEKNDRNWLEFLSLLDATFADLTLSENPSEEAIEATRAAVKTTQEFLTSVIEKDGARDRSGLLAQLELEKRARAHGVAEDQSRLLTLLEEYFEQIGDKACCFEDLKAYVLLEGDELADWSSFLDSLSSSFATEKQLQLVINVHKLTRYNLSKEEITVEKETARAAEYLEKYLEALKLGAELPSTELQPADDLALLTASAYVSLWTLTQADEWLNSAAGLLEYALTKSKQSFLARLMLIRIYRLLGAPNQALEHYRGLHIKQVQNDTLAHFMLSRSSNFSLAATGDLTLATECIESTQIYLSNSQETADFIIRAFTAEKYSQIPEFITFEDRLENSLQRDLVKMEHLRMRLTHENISSDIIDMELIELKFIFDRIHHDNRDTTILPDYQPRSSPNLNTQTILFNRYEGAGWLRTFLKVYIRVLQQGSDLDDTVEEKLLIGDRPKQRADLPTGSTLKDRLLERSEEDHKDLTSHEIALTEYATALANWLEPFHDYTRPPPSVVLAQAAKQTELKTGHPLKGIEIPPPSTNGNKKDEEPPVVSEAPEAVTQFFEDIKARFEEAKSASSPTELVHIATIAQEAFLLFVIESLRFKPTVVKIHKLTALATIIKKIRADAINILKEISAALIKRAETEGTVDGRKIFVDSCSRIIKAGIDHDFVLNVAKKETDSRKKLLEGVGKGIVRLCANYSNNN